MFQNTCAALGTGSVLCTTFLIWLNTFGLTLPALKWIIKYLTKSVITNQKQPLIKLVARYNLCGTTRNYTGPILFQIFICEIFLLINNNVLQGAQMIVPSN